jgi:carbonic anhydrase
MKTNTLDIDRRNFMRRTGSSLLAATVGSSLSLSAWRALAASSAETQTHETQSAITPQKALQMLKDGNSRFVQGNMLQRNLMQQVKATAGGQFPFAAIVGCIDSRVPNELIFDLGIGDIFSLRVAGNVVNDDILGSLEFACAAAGAKLIVVLGHTECGAVKGACDDVVLDNLTQTLAKIKLAVKAVSGYDSNRTSKNKQFVQAVTDKHVEQTVQRIGRRSPILWGMINNGKIGLVGAMYDVHNGKVTFM